MKKKKNDPGSKEQKVFILLEMYVSNLAYKVGWSAFFLKAAANVSSKGLYMMRIFDKGNIFLNFESVKKYEYKNFVFFPSCPQPRTVQNTESELANNNFNVV